MYKKTFGTLLNSLLHPTAMVAANSIPGNSFGITVPYHMFKTFPPEKMQRNGFFAQGGHLLFFYFFALSRQ